MVTCQSGPAHHISSARVAHEEPLTLRLPCPGAVNTGFGPKTKELYEREYSNGGV